MVCFTWPMVGVDDHHAFAGICLVTLKRNVRKQNWLFVRCSGLIKLILGFLDNFPQ